MLSISQIIILLTALFAAVLISLLHFYFISKNKRLNLSSEVLIYIVPLLFITFIGIEIIYFRYYLTFIFDFGWNAVLLSYTVLLLISLPLFRLLPGRRVFAFLKLPTAPVKKVTADVIKSMVETIKAEEPVLIEDVRTEESIETETQSQEAVSGTEETALPPEIEEPSDVQAGSEEKKPEELKPKHPKARTKHPAKPKAPPETHAKKPVVHKTKKKSP